MIYELVLQNMSNYELYLLSLIESDMQTLDKLFAYPFKFILK